MGREDVTSRNMVRKLDQEHDYITLMLLLESLVGSERLAIDRIGLCIYDSQPKKEVNIDDLGIQLHRGPKHPKYSTPESRLLTYTDWPRRLTRQTPETLVQAGFYYIGVSDQVRCFHCDGGLSSWDPTDDPFVEHARWFPHCGYITLVRGTQFVKDMLVEHPPVLVLTHCGFMLPGNPLAPGKLPQLIMQAPPAIRHLTHKRRFQQQCNNASLNIGLNRTETNEANQNHVDIIGESSQSLAELVDTVLDIQSNSSQDTSKNFVLPPVQLFPLLLPPLNMPLTHTPPLNEEWTKEVVPPNASRLEA
uniref:Uncharacterized protein n=1 Tax=Timema tahoe TaxID=61484 RepID=A0A7R9IDE4_9NEOP|nr:unnamed protein product [Timema tahoe]